MKILDENGALFGVVKAIDALVVGVLCAVGAGAYLAFDIEPTLLSGGPDTTKPADTTRFATLSLGTHDEYLARQFDSGDVVLETQDGSRAVVTDVFQSPRGARSSMTVRVEARRGPDGNVYFHDGRLREGRTLLLDLDSLLIDGGVLEMKSPVANATTSQATVDGLPTAIEARPVATANEVKR